MEILCPTRRNKGKNSFSFQCRGVSERVRKEEYFKEKCRELPNTAQCNGCKFPSPTAKFSRGERKRNTHFCTPVLFN